METTSPRPRIHRSPHLPAARDAMSTPMVRMPDGRLMVVFLSISARTSRRADVDAARARRMNATGSARSSREDDALTRRSTAMGRRARDEDEGSTGVGGIVFMGSVFVHRFDARLTMGATGARDGDARREREERLARRDSCRLSTRSIGGVRAQQPQIVLLREGTDSSQGRGQCVSTLTVARWRAARRRWGERTG